MKKQILPAGHVPEPSVEKTAIIRIPNGTEFTLSYTSLETLSSDIHYRLNKIWNENWVNNRELIDLDVTTVEYEPNRIVKWNFTMAHYCFDKGSLSESDLVKIIYFQNTMEANHE